MSIHAFIQAPYSRVFVCPLVSNIGNIRLEEGRPSDLWYSSCVDLLNSRFTPSSGDYDGLGVTGITVTSVARQVHT